MAIASPNSPIYAISILRSRTKKSNFQRRRGFDAITGKANFGIAEWMLIHLIEWMDARHGTVAMLVKQSVARKVFFHAWKEKSPLADARVVSNLNRNSISGFLRKFSTAGNAIRSRTPLKRNNTRQRTTQLLISSSVMPIAIEF